MGADIAGLDPDQLRFMIRTTRKDARLAMSYFTELLAASPRKLRAPVISVVGSRDRGTDYYQKRFKEWGFLSDSVTAVVLDEAGHFFMAHRAEELGRDTDPGAPGDPGGRHGKPHGTPAVPERPGGCTTASPLLKRSASAVTSRLVTVDQA